MRGRRCLRRTRCRCFRRGACEALRLLLQRVGELLLVNATALVDVDLAEEGEDVLDLELSLSVLRESDARISSRDFSRGFSATGFSATTSGFEERQPMVGGWFWVRA